MQQDVEILRVTPFRNPEGPGVAAVTFQCGPLTVRARLFEKDGRRWLGMPGRKAENGVWYDAVLFNDRALQMKADKAASDAYDRVVNLPEEMHPHPAYGPEPVAAHPA